MAVPDLAKKGDQQLRFAAPLFRFVPRRAGDAAIRAAGETSWLKIKNPTYSQVEGRHELFEARRAAATPLRRIKPTLVLA